MKQRCCNPSDKSFRFYGGRGIKICERWRESYSAFLEDMGRKPSGLHTLDRTDVDGDYEPANCCWSEMQQQAENRRNNRYVLLAGNAVTVTEASRRLGIDPGSLRYRVRRKGETLQAAVDHYASRRSIPLTVTGD